MDVDIPEPIRYAAEHQAAAEGLSPREWIERHFSYDPDAAAKSEEAFRAIQERLTNRAAKAA